MKKGAIEYRRGPWAIREDALPLIASQLFSGITEEELREQLSAFAPRGRAAIAGGVAVIPLHGLITPRSSLLGLLFGGSAGLDVFRPTLREAAGSDEVSAIVLDIDSPGGLTDLTAETAAEIREVASSKPVTAVANTMAASGAYWLASQAGEVVVTPSGEVGSIGVFAVHEDWSGFNERFGVDPTYVSAGRYKTELNPDEPLGDEARDALQQIVDEHYAQFAGDVAKGRDVKASEVRNGFGQGRMVTAKRAVSEGMADRVATLEATVARLAGTGSAGRRRAEHQKLSDRLASVVTDVEEVTERVADVVAMRAEKGKGLGEASREAAARLEPALTQLSALLSESEGSEEPADEDRALGAGALAIEASLSEHAAAIRL